MNSLKSTILFLFSLSMFVNQAIAQVPSYVPSNGLVGWWPFTGNANDLSGNGNNGTVNGPTLTSDRFGNANQAYLNNTSSGSITLNSGVLDNLGAFNVGIWFNASNSQSGVSDIFQIDANSPCAIYPGQTANPNNNLYVRYDNGLAQFYFSIQINSTVVQYTVPSPPSTNNWHFVSVNYSGTSVSFFLNGQLLNTQPLSGTFLTFNQPLFIANWCTYEDFNGKIDDIGIWNRALTQQEITNLYNANNGPQATISTANNSICAGQSATLTASVANAGTSCNTTGLPPSLNNGLVGYWPFCGNANDASGNGNNGTVNGPILTNDRFSSSSSSYNFNNNHIITNYLGISSNNPRSFSLWKNGTFGDLISYGGSVDLPGCGDAFRIIDNNGTIEINTDCSSRSFQIPNYNQTNWYHIVVVGGASLDNFQVYVNGVICNLSNSQGTGVYNTSVDLPVNFGRCHRGNSYYSGKIDDIGIWNRALTAQEVSQLYNAGQPTYAWSNGATTPSITVTPTQTTTYTCTITMNGATTTQTQTITVNAIPTLSAGQNQAICAGTAVTLSGSGATSYTWNNGVLNGVAFTPNNTQTYTVTGTDANGCSNTAQVQVTVNALPTVSAGANQTVCAGTAVTLSGSGASSYAWNNGVTNAVAFTPNATTTYTVTGTAANGCTNTAQTTVTVNALPTVGAGSNQTVCAGTQVTLSGSGAASYSWNNGVTNAVAFTPNATTTYTVTGTAANGCTNTAQVQVVVNALPAVSGGQNQSVCAGASLILNGAGALTYTWNNNIQNGVSFIPNATQTYTVIGTNANGCQNSAQVQVTVNPLPTVSAGLPIAVCSGTNVVLFGSGAQSYSWSNGIQNAVPFIPGSTQVYTVTGTDANGCTDTDQILVTVNSYPQVSAGQNQTVCAGDSVTLTASGAPSYSWSNGIVNGVSFVPASTTTYSVIGNSNGCLDTAQVTVTVNPLPTVSAGQAQTVCAGSSVTLNATGASTYLWDNNVQNSVAFVPNTTQLYTVTGTDINGCENTAQITVIVNTLPTVSGGQNQSVCAGTTLVLNGAGALTYTWNNNIQNGVSFIPNATQTYTVIGTDTNGCQGTDQVLVEVLSPTVSEINEVACVEFTLNGQSYTQSGTYIQNLSNVAGCDSTLTLNLTINELPSIPVISSSNDNILSIDAQANVTYQWIFCNSGLFINNATDTIYSPTVNGVYGIELTNGCGTVSSECITINNMNVPELMNEILVYPNPSHGLVYIQGLTETAIPFKLQDITGRVVLEGMLNSSSNVLDITRLSSGNYRLLVPGYGIFSLVKQ